MRAIKIFICLGVIMHFGCGISKDDNVYNFISKGEPLSKEILIKAEQIVFHESDIILKVNISKIWNVHDYHLLFFDYNKKLTHACFFPSNYIDSVKNNRIYAIFSQSRYDKRNHYINELPPKYQFNFHDNEKVNNSSRKSDKLVDSIEFHGGDIELFVRKSSDIFTGLRWSSSNKDTSFFSKYFELDTVVVPFHRLSFDYNKQTIIIGEQNNKGDRLQDVMIIKKKQILDRLYDQILNKY